MHQKAAGARVRRLRVRRALTQEQLAEVAGIAVRTVQRAEDGVMSADTVTALATALDVPVDGITEGHDAGYPQITPMLYYNDQASLDWLVRAFGMTVRMRHVAPDGRISHAELTLDDGVIMAIAPGEGGSTPASLGGVCTQGLYVNVDDVDAHHERATREGATVLTGLEDAHGHRRYLAADPEGHLWQFWTQLP